MNDIYLECQFSVEDLEYVQAVFDKHKNEDNDSIISLKDDIKTTKGYLYHWKKEIEMCQLMRQITAKIK